ncbi:BRCT domain-containing protein At4g02110-like [Actinidia eriantha]|uniref:BRCT domain-containing protein At4g02110-like n=1 Tax=Actinidia eriantha TaxID=165200 RepID=UPI002582B938|nr:BRCT domain-containing protein At4g02110-like [Actinidia eriantha]
MLETKQDSTAYDHLSKTFIGVRFVLLGFDPVNAQKARSKLMNGGGVDVFQYGPNCTHVIVDKLIYDDPVCAAAQTDGKVLVTELWVDHSFDIGMPVDPTSVLYTPLRDLEGIPGAKSLIVCLTGYQRQDRDDIMTMVGLMGAKFSKPLVANKVTHLICYKFEGEKYELAKKMKKIKLVNHQWLEDCLRVWEILPEANYDKSGYELEMMEAEAKDSEEDDAQEIAKKQYGGSKDNVSPHNLHIGTVRAHPSPLSKDDILKNLLPASASKGLPSARNNNDTVLATAEETVTGQALNLQGIHKKIPGVLCSGDTRTVGDVTCGEPSEQPLKPYDKTPPSDKSGNALASTSGSAKRSPHSNAAKLSLLSYSRKIPRRNTLSLFSGEMSSNVSSIPKVDINKLNTHLMSRAEQAKDGTDTGFVKTPSKETKLYHEGDKGEMLPEKRKMDGSYGSSKAQKMSHNPKAPITGSPLLNHITGCSEQNSPEIGSLGIEKSYDPRLGSPKGNNAGSLSKPVRKKAIAKKSLCTRPRLGPGNTKYKKDSIYLNEIPLQSDDVISLNGGKETADTEMFVTSEKVEMIPSTVAINKTMVMETDNAEKSHNEVESKTGSMDDETETPEQKEEHEFEAGDGEEKPEDVDPTHEMNIVMKDKLEEDQPAVTIKADASSLSAHDLVKTSEEDELEKEVCGRKNNPNKSTTNADGGKEKSTKLKKHPLSKTLRKPILSVTGRSKSKDVVHGEESRSKQNNEETGKEKEKSIPSCTGKTKKTVSLNKSKNSTEVEKENKPVGTGDQNVNHGEQQVGKVTSKLKRTPTRIARKASFTGQDSAPAERVPKVKVESVWFILSGHKLQRKEFQQVIRRLKGKVCRDSHQWSYQATHFIAPDPIRRTEKFFAAAASGRWILKTDYLTASNQEARFLPEDPYEWHKKGLSEDGAINLEAPRKWRLLRERTGHGAFYGMRIIIYGECIAPPLDTLKRVIRAGDGTLLATSPPYTRFLESGVDFAIVSPGMPRVDIWVQEFLRHEIPCVVADYLVEYVCKPGYSLERLVQHNTHAWAGRSFANLQRRSEEVVMEQTTPEDRVNSNLSCQVCRSCDRGEVMLICGDESDSTGCGVGTHIDCFNPLEHVPDEDWFCPKCRERRNSTSRPKNTKKKTPLSKGK